MKKSLKISAFSLLFVLSAVTVHASTGFTFTSSFGYGTRGAQVTQLQNILITQGFLSAGSATGNYFTLTQNAVSAFQAAHNVQATGYFGPLTRALANAILAGQVSSAPQATVSLTSVKNSSSNTGTGLSQAAAAFLSVSGNGGTNNTKTITWQTSGYPDGVGLNINLIRKTSDNPKTYTFVRTIAKDTPNDGVELWDPQADEMIGGNLYIEITCSTDHAFNQGCQVGGVPVAVQ